MPTSSEISVSVGTTDSFLVASAPLRRGLLLIPPAANRYTVSTLPSATLDQGITLYPGDRPVLLRYEQHGDLPTRQFRAISAIAAQTVTFYELFD